jgi:Tfp pilus assembly protein PilW
MAPGSARLSRRETGVSLIELAVVVALVALVFLGVVGVWSRTQAAYVQTAELADIQQDVRAGYERLSREVRLAGMAPCHLSTPPGGAIATGSSSTSITIEYRQADPASVDCATAPPAVQTVAYSRDAATSQLMRNGAPVVGSVQSLSFQYFRCDGSTASLSTAAERNRIARVFVRMTTRASVAGQPLTRRLESEIRLRNVACSGSL